MNWTRHHFRRALEASQHEAMERHQDYVLRTVEERGVRFDPAVVHRRARHNSSPSRSHRPSSRTRSRRGCTFDGSAIDGFSRIQESDVLASPIANELPAAALGEGGDDPGPGVLRHRQPRRLAVRGRPPSRPEAQPRPRRRRGLPVHVSPPRSSSSTSSDDPPRCRSRSTRLATSTSRPSTWPATCASGRSVSSRRWASPSSTRSTRTPRASTRSTSATPTPSRWPTTS